MMLARRFRQLIVSEIASSWDSKNANALVWWTTSYKPFCSKNLSPYREQGIDWSPDVSDSFDPQVGHSTITKCTATPVWPQTVLTILRENLSVISEAEQINTWMYGVPSERVCLFPFLDWVFCKTSINIVCKSNFKSNCHFLALLKKNKKKIQWTFEEPWGVCVTNLILAKLFNWLFQDSQRGFVDHRCYVSQLETLSACLETQSAKLRRKQVFSNCWLSKGRPMFRSKDWQSAPSKWKKVDSWVILLLYGCSGSVFLANWLVFLELRRDSWKESFFWTC